MTKVLVPILEIPIKLATMAQAALNVVNPLKLLGQAIEFLTGLAQKLWHWITGNSPGLIPAFHELSGVVGQVAGAIGGVLASGFGKAVDVRAVGDEHDRRHGPREMGRDDTQRAIGRIEHGRGA